MRAASTAWQVRGLLEKIRAPGRIKNGERVFRIRDPKKALTNACKRL
jgi:hypothetical protein